MKKNQSILGALINLSELSCSGDFSDSILLLSLNSPHCLQKIYFGSFFFKGKMPELRKQSRRQVQSASKTPLPLSKRISAKPGNRG